LSFEDFVKDFEKEYGNKITNTDEVIFNPKPDQIISKCSCGFKGNVNEILAHTEKTKHTDIEMIGATK
jgi:hypothetical protein